MSAQASTKSLTDLGRTTLAAIRAALGNGFDPGGAGTATRLLGGIAAEAGQLGHGGLHKAAQELTSHLAWFVETRASPDEPQLEQLRTLARRFAERLRVAATAAPEAATAADAAAALPAPPEPVPTSAAAAPAPEPEPELPAARVRPDPAVLYVHGHEVSVPDLASYLARRGLRLETVTTGEAVDDWIEREVPLAVLVDVDYFAALPEVIESVERGAPQHAMRIPVLALMPRADIAARLQAAIGGADALLEAPDAAGVLARLDELLAPLEGEPYRVLIVDDDRQQAMYCEVVLKKKGMKVMTAPSAEIALKLLDSFDPELLLVDLHMPGVNGMELTARVRERRQPVLLPIIFLTGELEPQIRFDALNVGGDDFFTKPIRPRHLATAVAGRIKRARYLKRQLAHSLAAVQPGTLLPRGHFLDRLRAAAASATPEHAPGQAHAHGALLYLAIDQGALLLDDQFGLIARGELEQAVAIQVLAALRDSDAVTVWQDCVYLALLERDSSAELAAAAEATRARVAGQPYKVHDGELQLSVSIGLAERATAQGDAERWLRSARAASQFARSGGGNAVEVVPLALPAGLGLEDSFALRELLRRGPERATCRIDYQPMVQLRGPHAGQYWQYLRLQAGAGAGKVFQRADYVGPARAGGRLVALERHAIERAIEALEGHGRQRGKPLRLATHCSAENLLAKLPQWLDQTIGAESSWPGALILAFDATELLLLSATQRSLIEALPRPGVRLMLAHYQGTPEQQRLIDGLPFSEVELAASWLDNARPDDELKPLHDKVSHLRKAAKSVIARDLRHVALLSTLWSIGVDYIVADVLREPGPALDYDFSKTAAPTG